MIERRADVEKIETVYLSYLKSKAPKNIGWFSFLGISLLLLVAVPVMAHNIWKLPTFPGEGDLWHMVLNLIGIVFLCGMLMQEFKSFRHKIRPKFPAAVTEYDTYVQKLRGFSEEALGFFLILKKDEWSLDEKTAEMMGGACVVVIPLVILMGKMGEKFRPHAAFLFLLVALAYFLSLYYRRQVVKLRRFESFLNQAISEKKKESNLELIS